MGRLRNEVDILDTEVEKQIYKEVNSVIDSLNQYGETVNAKNIYAWINHDKLNEITKDNCIINDIINKVANNKPLKRLQTNYDLDLLDNILIDFIDDNFYLSDMIDEMIQDADIEYHESDYEVGVNNDWVEIDIDADTINDDIKTKTMNYIKDNFDELLDIINENFDDIPADFTDLDFILEEYDNIFDKFDLESEAERKIEKLISEVEDNERLQ